jgi:ketosteroid isomerase-like protein
VSAQNVEAMRRGYELFAQGDIEAVVELLAEDVEIVDSGGLGPLSDSATEFRHGREGFIQASREALEAFDDFTIEAEDFIDAGDSVVVPVTISGRGRSSGAEMESRLAHRWVFREDGKAIRSEVYPSAEEALTAARRS